MERHRSALAGMAGHRNELAAYDAMVGLARRLSLDAAATGAGAGPSDAAPDTTLTDMVLADVRPADAGAAKVGGADVEQVA